MSHVICVCYCILSAAQQSALYPAKVPYALGTVKGCRACVSIKVRLAIVEYVCFVLFVRPFLLFFPLFVCVRLVGLFINLFLLFYILAWFGWGFVLLCFAFLMLLALFCSFAVVIFSV